MATIVQNYGPIYGEVVNGTVQGRPNGSVYVPISNTVNLTLPSAYIKKKTDGTRAVWPCTADGTFIASGVSMIAQSQDLASNMVLQLFSDAELTQQIGASITSVAGAFNRTISACSIGLADDEVLVNGDPYYLVLSLMNNGVPVAVDVVTVEGVA